MWDHSVHCIIFLVGEIAPGVGAKTRFLSSIQHGLSDTHLSPISTVFETTDVNRCAGAYTREKFPNFCVGVLQAPKKLRRERYFGLGASYERTAQTAQFQETGIISEASRHPKDVPLVREF